MPPNAIAWGSLQGLWRFRRCARNLAVKENTGMTRILIKSGMVVTLDPGIGDLPRGDVLIERKRSTPGT
jgi:hypothetical protein